MPIAQVSSELFNQWGDFYYPDTIHFKLAFDEKEREIISDFNKLIRHVCDKLPSDLPYITEFVNTNDWILVNKAAIDTVKRINTVAKTKK